jgi:L-threonylcarbamoyladenylate synthase
MVEQETRCSTDLHAACALLAAGDVVAVPTETVYGLAGDATNATAVARIYAAKARPQFNPLIAHVADAHAAWQHIVPTPMHQKLADAFWPGPLTLLGAVQPASTIAPLARAGLAHQAMRVPAHPLMRDLLAAFEKPLVAPSANASGRISPTRAAHVLASLGGRIPMVLDGGPCALGLESTIIGFDGEMPLLLRAGAIAAEAIAEAIGLMPAQPSDMRIQALGQMASHYAPRTPLLINMRAPQPGDYMIGFGDVTGDVTLSASGDLVEAAAQLFELLHQADASGAARICVAPIPTHGLGAAINDRRARADSNKTTVIPAQAGTSGPKAQFQ